MRISKQYFLVRINKAAQEKKRSMTKGGILVHPDFVFMERNLQFGTIVQIGGEAQKNYPLAGIGNEIYFHHTIEDSGARVLHVEDNGDELLWVYGGNLNQNHEVYGFASEEHGLVSSPHYIWLKPDVARVKLRPKTDTSLILESEMGDDWDAPDVLQDKIDKLKLDIEDLTISIKAPNKANTQQQEYDRCEGVINAINRIKDEQAFLTRLKSSKRFGIGKIFAFNPETRALLPGLSMESTLFMDLPVYPLEIYNETSPKDSAQFMVVRPEFVAGYYNE